MQTIKELSTATELFLAHHVPRDKYWVDTWFDSEEPVILCWLLEKIVYPMQWEKARRHKYGHDSSPEVHTVPGVKTLADNFEFSAERWSKVTRGYYDLSLLLTCCFKKWSWAAETLVEHDFESGDLKLLGLRVSENSFQCILSHVMTFTLWFAFL